MKRGNRSCLPVTIGIDLDTVEKIEFIFQQGSTVRLVVYPSNEAKRRGTENIVDVSWSGADTMAFSAAMRVNMDTRIHIKGLSEQPDTSITSFSLLDTLFEEAAADA